MRTFTINAQEKQDVNPSDAARSFEGDGNWPPPCSHGFCLFDSILIPASASSMLRQGFLFVSRARPLHDSCRRPITCLELGVVDRKPPLHGHHDMQALMIRLSK